MESLWSVHSTRISDAYAREALQLARDHLWRAVHSPSAETRYAMSRSAHLSGRAINITRTTAPHALSYAMTSHFGVPHGHAVALTLGEILAYNSGVCRDDVADERGADHVDRVMAEIRNLMGASDVDTARRRIVALANSVGLATRLRDVGICTPDARELIVAEANPQRLANNPRALPEGRLRKLIDRIA
jgi:alcohol dehydrogenase class IV